MEPKLAAKLGLERIKKRRKSARKIQCFEDNTNRDCMYVLKEKRSREREREENSSQILIESIKMTLNERMNE